MKNKSKIERRVLSRNEYLSLQERLKSSVELTPDEREVLLSLVEGYAFTQQELQKANSSIERLKNFF